jgi:MFS family permease
MTPSERRVTLHLAAIYGLRMLGMFIILPVFALYAEGLPGGHDRLWVGLTLGAYGLTQAVLQIPFGWLSDRFGRKRLLYIGLLMFAAGSFVAAWAPNVQWILVGRMLQGAGAISGVLLALLSDMTRFSVRTKAMAAIGITIGSTFALSMMIAPVLKDWFGVPGIFVLTGILAMVAFLDIRYGLPELRHIDDGSADVNLTEQHRSFWRATWDVLKNPDLARLNFGIFVLHAVLMALFVQIPFDLRTAGLPEAHHWYVYLPVLIISLALLMPVMRRIDHPNTAKFAFRAAITILLVGHVVLAFNHSSLVPLVIGLLLFFIGFNQLEAALPSLISKRAPAEIKGTATGIYGSLQFLGTFVGAAVGGALVQYAGESALFWSCVGICVVWWFIVFTDKKV